MTKNKKYKLILFSVFILSFVILAALYILTWSEHPETKAVGPVPISSPTPGVGQIQEKEEFPALFPPAPSLPTATLLINGEKFEGEISGPMPVYNFMEKMRKEDWIGFADKTYLGMGKIITSINGIKSRGDMTWIYYVNGKEAEIGVSKYIINPGDVVSWKYEKLKY